MDEWGQTTEGRHFTCSMASVLVRRMRAHGGDEAVAELLTRARSPRDVSYLEDPTNWISYDEAMALLEAAVELSGDQSICRRVGEDAVRQHAGTPVATLLRSLGTPEAVYEQITMTAGRFSTVTDMEVIEVRPGRAVVSARSREGFKRHEYHCDWTAGLLSTTPTLFGMPLAHIEETECQARGGDRCLYTASWDEALAAQAADPAQHVTALEAQLTAMTERLQSMYATAGDLIDGGDIDSTLARITERAATAVRAPRYLLAVRAAGGAHCHHDGFDEAEAEDLAARVLDAGDAELQLERSWLVADVRSHRQDYGRLIAVQADENGFFPQERELFTLYGRYAAAALDGATTLAEAERRHELAQALLELSRAVAAAGTREEVAQRLADAVPAVVDCDALSVFVWNEATGVLECKATYNPSPDQAQEARELVISPADTPELADLLASPVPEPRFYEQGTAEPFVRAVMERFGAVALVISPIIARGHFLGVLSVSVKSEPDRLRPRPDLLDRLSGVVANAASALENAQLLEQVIHQARHDALTGLANRSHFADEIVAAVTAARERTEPVALFYVDLDEFKSVNDHRGHAAGDALLCQVADRLLSTVRAGDTVARLGGDEFAIVLRGVTSEAEVDAATERIEEAFSEPFEIFGEPLTIGASVGRATWPDDCGEIESLMRHADAAMYGAKLERRRRRHSSSR